MDILKVIILSIVSELELFILTKIMGNKAISQLSMFDYILGITIGSIAAEMATSLEKDFWHPLIAMIIYIIVEILISFGCLKSIKFRRFVYGNSLILLDNDILYKKNFNKAKLDLNEFLVQCRNNGYFNLSEIQTAIFESTGKISFLPKSPNRPTTPNDFNLSPSPSSIETNVIINGKIIYNNLKKHNVDEMWLQKKLVSQGFEKLEKIFLGILDNENNLTLYKSNNFKNSQDLFS